MFNESDAEKFFTLISRSREYLKEWMAWLDNIKSVEDVSKNIQGRLEAFVENGGHPKSFAIIYKGDIAGTIGFNEIHKKDRIGLVGYWLGEEFQGNGIMAKALNTLIDYGFKELKLNRVEIHVAVENKKSRALPERFGFVEEGRFRQAEWLNDHYVDHIIYALLAEEWRTK
ncbi:GNAT family N-acetyltransferase [Bacillus carboniphilus]|uniref:GNAT family N-acetyltransferase n=1 Tax=Bacillus carboniphilus TaxID=86663 RepID=A0ABY9JTX8_9BACI|nr:GNAT family N-acetyltransferase [Bacillus carboniphilus]WLR42203.1 GNAT family N-acetyltransferase [Bacillus carboniphilus]